MLPAFFYVNRYMHEKKRIMILHNLAQAKTGVFHNVASCCTKFTKTTLHVKDFIV